MLKSKGASKGPCGTSLYHVKTKTMDLFLFFAYSEKDNHELIKVPHYEHHSI